MAYQPLLGLCPIGKFVFSHEDAVYYKQRLQALLTEMGVRYVDLDTVLPDGMVRDIAHVEPAVAYMKAQGIDGVMLPHCNFGTESAAGMIGRQLGVPVLLWGPRDEAPQPDGTRLRDSLCGLMASSKVLRKLGVPFTYVENCRVDDPPLRAGIDTFRRAANVARTFRQGARIGHIGQRIDFFWTTIVNESELLERFRVSVLPIDMVTFIRDARDRAERGRDRYQAEVTAMKRDIDLVGLSDDLFIGVLAVRDQMLALTEEHGLDVLAVQDFNSLLDEMGAYCFFANSLVSDTVPLGCESDIHGALSCLLLHRATLGEPVFLADVTVRHPTDDNGVLIWHAGAPLSMRDPAVRPRLGLHWILPSPVSGMPHFPLRQGPITLARFDGDTGRYEMATGQGDGIDGPDTLNNYVWMRVDDWPHWERTLIEGPYIHHAAMAYGHHADALTEAGKYIDGVQLVRLDDPARSRVR